VSDSSAPDLIVHGILDKSRSIADIKKDLAGIMDRLVSGILHANPALLRHCGRTLAACTDVQHVLVIGPGLGRDQHMQDCARAALELARGMDQMGVVVDADGLWLVQVSRAL
jgi:ATP-dependent NAD(P)H-hydrate dehydratase